MKGGLKSALKAGNNSFIGRGGILRNTTMRIISEVEQEASEDSPQNNTRHPQVQTPETDNRKTTDQWASFRTESEDISREEQQEEKWIYKTGEKRKDGSKNKMVNSDEFDFTKQSYEDEHMFGRSKAFSFW